jgi:sporulation protein YlmC with PRC-barrel domain
VEQIMPFFAEEIFVSDVHKKPVLDQMGEEIGRLKDIIVSGGEALPAVTSLVVASGQTT